MIIAVIVLIIVLIIVIVSVLKLVVVPGKPRGTMEFEKPTYGSGSFCLGYRNVIGEESPKKGDTVTGSVLFGGFFGGAPLSINKALLFRGVRGVAGLLTPQRSPDPVTVFPASGVLTRGSKQMSHRNM